jgi:hypothetical protein
VDFSPGFSPNGKASYNNRITRASIVRSSFQDCGKAADFFRQYLNQQTRILTRGVCYECENGVFSVNSEFLLTFLNVKKNSFLTEILE